MSNKQIEEFFLMAAVLEVQNNQMIFLWEINLILVYANVFNCSFLPTWWKTLHTTSVVRLPVHCNFEVRAAVYCSRKTPRGSPLMLCNVMLSTSTKSLFFPTPKARELEREILERFEVLFSRRPVIRDLKRRRRRHQRKRNLKITSAFSE